MAVYGENAGQHLLLHHNEGMSESEMIKRAEKAGVRVYPLSPYFQDEIPEKYQGTVLIGYATMSEEELIKGVSLLKKIW